jgi:hypothetical protein
MNNRIIIIEDCRPNGNAKGMLGIYEGDFPYKNEEGEWKNPRLKLDDGQIIWGIECWWKPYEKFKNMKESENEVKNFYDELNKHFEDTE